MAVAALVIFGALAIAALGALVVLRLDRNATLRSVKVKAQAWKTINIDFQLERDAEKTGSTADVLSIAAAKEAATAVSPKATAPQATNEPAGPTPRARHRSVRNRTMTGQTMQDADPTDQSTPQR